MCRRHRPRRINIGRETINRAADASRRLMRREKLMVAPVQTGELAGAGNTYENSIRKGGSNLACDKKHITYITLQSITPCRYMPVYGLLG